MSLLVIFILVLAVGLLVQTFFIVIRRKIDGYIVIIMQEDGRKMFSLEIDRDPDNINPGDHILFKVVDEPTEDFE